MITNGESFFQPRVTSVIPRLFSKRDNHGLRQKFNSPLRFSTNGGTNESSQLANPTNSMPSEHASITASESIEKAYTHPFAVHSKRSPWFAKIYDRQQETWIKRDRDKDGRAPTCRQWKYSYLAMINLDKKQEIGTFDLSLLFGKIGTFDLSLLFGKKKRDVRFEFAIRQKEKGRSIWVCHFGKRGYYIIYKKRRLRAARYQHVP